MKAATKPLGRLLRDLFRVEALEPRVLLSADPVLGAAQLVLRPADEDGSALLQVQSYAPRSDVAAPQAVQAAAQPRLAAVETLEVAADQLGAGNGDAVLDDAGDAAFASLMVAPQAPAMRMMAAAAVASAAVIDEDVSVPDPIHYLSSAVVVGDRVLEAGNDGSGDVQMGGAVTHTLDGDGSGAADSLRIRSPGDVRFYGAVGSNDPLAGLTIEGALVDGSEARPRNVVFDRTVVIDGDLVITATGKVTFNDEVIITGGGSLRILGASEILFRAGVTLSGTTAGGQAGDLFLEADEINFQGGDESVSGRGVLTLRPTTVGATIEVASPRQPEPGTVLNLTNEEIGTFAQGFERIVIGHRDGLHAAAGAGLVRIGAINSLDQPTLRDPLEVYGGSIIVDDYSSSDYILLVEGSILLDARDDIVLRNRVEASVGEVLADITLYSENGRVLQEDVTLDQLSAEPLRAATLTVRAAKGISLGFTELDALSASNTVSGDLRVVEAVAGGDLRVIQLHQQAASGAISLLARDGNVAIEGGVSTAGSGPISLEAAGSGHGITVTQRIASAGGAISLLASGDITTSEAGTDDGAIVTGAAAAVHLTSSAGAITQGGLIASAGGEVKLDAFGALTMVDGFVARSVGDEAGAVKLRAGGNVLVSVVEADGSISVTSGGSILDGLTGTSPNLDGETAAVLLAAASGIGGGSAALQTRVGSLAASNSGSGGIFVHEATALRIAGASGEWGIDAAGGGNAVVILTADGGLSVEQGVRSGGNLLLQTGEADETTVADLAIGARLVAGGSLGLDTADGLGIGGAAGLQLQSGGAGHSLDIHAQAGITMAADAQLLAQGGKLHLLAGAGDVVLGQISNAGGAISVAAAGSILAAGTVAGVIELSADTLRLVAGGSIGTAPNHLDTAVATLAASAGGAVFLQDVDALTVATLAALDIQRVAGDGTTSIESEGVSLAGLQAGAALVLRSGAALTIDDDLLASGHLHVGAQAGLALNAVVGSSGGSVTLRALAAITASAEAEVYSEAAAGTVDLQAGAAISLAHGSVVRTDAQAIRIAATTDLAIGRIDARSAADRLAGSTVDGWGDVSLGAGGALADAAAATGESIAARNLRLAAGSGIGASGQPLEIEVRGVLAADSGSGAMFLTDPTALNVGAVAAIGLRTVATDGTASAWIPDAAADGLVSGAALVLRALDGALTLASGEIVAAGNVLLQAEGTGGSLSLQTELRTAGDLSLHSAAAMTLDADVETTAAGKTMDLRSGATISQAQDTSLTSNDGAIALAATGDVTIERIAAGTGGVWISAAAIVDGGAAGDSEVDISAGAAQLTATAGIGAAGAALETSVGQLAAQAADGLFLTESDGLTVQRLTVDVRRVDGFATTALTSHAALEGVRAASVVLASLAGELVLTHGQDSTVAVQASAGALRLDAGSGSLVVRGGVQARDAISMLAGTSMGLESAAAIGSSTGSADLSAGTGITMHASSSVQTGGEAIRLHAGGDIILGALDARTAADRGAGSLGGQADWGTVSVVAGGGIADNAGNTATRIHAQALRLGAVQGIGASAQHIEIETAQLAAQAGAQGLFLQEATALQVTQVALTTGLDRVGADAIAVAGPQDAALTGLGSGGALVLQTVHGSITLAGSGHGAVTAGGNLLLAAQGAGADLVANAGVSSSGGHLSLQAQRDLLLAADVGVAGAGKTVDLVAGRDLTQSQATQISSHSGNVALQAGGVATLEAVVAGGSSAIRVAAASIVDGDAAGDSEVDLSAASLELVASGAIGAAGAQLETDTDTLAFGAGGDVFVNNTGALAVSSLTVNVERVDATGAATLTSHALRSGLSGDDVVLRALGGSLSVHAGALVSTTGALLLEATGGASDVTLSAATQSAGALSLIAGGAVTLNANLATTTDGATIDVWAQGGRLVNAQGSSIVAANANVQLQALNSVTLEQVTAGSGTVRIAGSSVVDGDAAGDSEVDVSAAGLMVTTTGAVGLGANALETAVGTLTVAAGGSVTIVESDALVLGTLSASVDRVGLDGVALATTAASQSGLAGAAVVVRTLGGSLTSQAGNTVSASGNLLLRAAGDTSDLTLGAAVSSGGNASLEAGRDLLQNANVALSASGKTLDLRAGRHLAQAQGVSTSTNAGNAALTAGGTLTIEAVSVGIGRVGLIGASIVDGDAAGDSEVDVLAGQVRMQATGGDIGSGANALETTTSSLALAATGDIFITETDDLTLQAVSVSVTRVQDTGVDAGASESVVLSNVSGRAIVVRTLAGGLKAETNGSVTASGNVLLQAVGATADLNLLGGVSTSGGQLSLSAGRDLLLNANVANTFAGGSIDLQAVRHITQSQTRTVTAAGGNIALQAGDTATIESLDAGSGAVRIAAASVVDGDAGNDSEVDVRAQSLLLQVSSATASGSNALETAVANLAAAGGGQLFLTESDDLLIGSLQVNVQRVAADATASATTHAAVAGLATGTTVVRTVDGALASAVGASVVASGNLLLQAGGTASDLTLDADVSGSAHVTLAAGRDLLQNANVAALVLSQSLRLQAGRDVVQADGAVARANGGPLSVQAGRNAVLSHLAAAGGTVRVQAVDVSAADAGAGADAHIAATALQLAASGDVGAAGADLRTDIASLSAGVDGVLFLDEATALEIGATSLLLQRVGSDGATVSDAAVDQSGLRSGADAVVRTEDGSLTSNAQGTVTVTGKLLLQARGTASDLALNASVTVGGEATLDGQRDVLLGATVTATGAGSSIEVLAGRSIVQSQGHSLNSNNGVIGLHADSGDATIEQISAGTAGVRISARAIIDGDAGGDGEVDILAGSAQLRASGAIGASGAALETSVGTLSAHAGGAIFLTESDGLALGALAIAHDSVDADGALFERANWSQSGVSGTIVVLQTLAGALSVDSAVDASGNLLLRAGGAGSDLTLDAAITGAGHMALSAGRDLLQDADVSASTSGSTLELLAGRHVTQAQGVSATVNDGVLHVHAAAGDATLESLAAGTGKVRVDAVHIVDGDAAGDSESDISAGDLQLVASGAVGSAGNAIETTVTRLAAQADGAIFLTESDALVLGAVSVSLQRVQDDGSATALAALAQSGVDGAAIVLRTLAGSLSGEAGSTIAASGHLLLQSGAGHDLSLASAVSSSGGSISLDAGRNLLLEADVRTTAAGESIDLLAANAISQSQDTAIATANGAIALEAVAGDATIERIDAGSAAVRISAGAIIDGDASGDAEIDIAAGVLQLLARGAIGSSGAALETAVGTLSAQAAGDVFLTDDATLAVDTVTVSLGRVAADGTLAALEHAAQSGLGGATIVLRVLAGALSTAAGNAVDASGNLLLASEDGALRIGADVTAAGAISLAAGADLVLAGDVRTTDSGSTIDLVATGDLEQSQGAAIVAADADVQLLAGGTVTLETINAGSGSVSIAAATLRDGDDVTAGDDGEADILAAGLQIRTTGGTGLAGNALETTVTRLSVDAGGAIHLSESDDLLLQTVTTTVQRVGSDGVALAQAATTQSDVAGGVVVVLAGGTLESAASGAVSASGNLLLSAAGDLVLGADAESVGHMTLQAGGDLLQNADITTSGAGASLLLLAAGDVTQAEGVAASSNDGALGVDAGGTLTVERISAGTANVALQAAAIVDGDAAGDSEIDVLAGGLLVTTTAGVGSAANALETAVDVLSLAAGGDVFLQERDGALRLGTVSASLQQVGEDGLASVLPALAQQGVSGATLVVRTASGALTSETTGAVTASGKLLLQAGGTADLTLGADVTSSGGAITLAAGGAFSQAQGTAIASAGGDVSLLAGGSATIESIDAGSGAVHIDSASVVDGDSDPAESEIDIRAGALLLTGSGATGSGANPLETAVASLTTTGGGDLFLVEADGLRIGALAGGVARVAADGSSSLVTNSDSGLDNGMTVVRTLAGALAVDAGATIAATGNLLLQAGGADSDLAIAGSVAGAAHVSLLAGRDLLQDAGVQATGAGTSLLLQAGRHVTQGAAGLAQVLDGALAVQAGGTATLASLAAGTGAVRVAAAAIVDGDAAGDSAVDIVAGQLLLQADGAIGSAANAIETAVDSLSAHAGGDLFLADIDALALGRAGIALQRVDADGSTLTDTPASQDGVQSGGSAVIQALAGSLASDAQGAVTAAGNLLLRAVGAGSDVTLGAQVRSTGGHLGVEAGRDLLLNADVTAQGSGSAIFLQAGRSILQAQDRGVSSTNGAIALEAGTGDVRIEQLAAGSAGVRVAAGGAIVDGDAAGDGEVDITAGSLLLQAGAGIGAADAGLETRVAKLAAQAGGDIFVTEADALVLDALSLDVQRVGADAASTVASHALAGVRGATVVVNTLAGALSSTAGAAVAASGHLLLQAGGGQSGLTLAGGTSAAGALSLAAAGSVVLTGSVSSSGLGASIDVLAGTSIDARQGSTIRSNHGDVSLQAQGGNVTLEHIAAGGGVVRISGNSIVDGDAKGDSEVDIVAAGLLLTARGSVGASTNTLETSVDTLSVQATGSVNVTESKGLVLGAVSAAGTQRVALDGSVAPLASVSQAGVAGTSIAVRTLSGALSVQEDVRGSSTISLQGRADVVVGAGVEVRTAGKSAIQLESQTGSVLMDAASATLVSSSGRLELQAHKDIRVGGLVSRGLAQLHATTGSVRIEGDLRRNGGDLEIVARDLVIAAPLQSVGGVLRIAATDGRPVIVGGPAPGGKSLHVDTGELGRLRDGFEQIVIGSSLPGQVVELRGTAGQLVFRDPLVIEATGAGGKVLVSGKVRGDTLTVRDSGGKTTLAGATIAMMGNLLVQDQLVLKGANSLLAAHGGSGSLRLAGAIGGTSRSVDTLTLDGSGGDIRIDQAIAGIEGLTIRDARNVSFGAGVAVAGKLAIEASGTIGFKGALKLSAGGQMLVSGGGKLVFGASADLGSGDHLLRVSAIQAKGGVGSIRGSGELELRAPSNAGAIHIGSGAPKGALVVGNDVLKAIGKGFEAVVVGNGGARVSMGAADLRSTASPLQVDAKTIAVAASGSGLRLGTALTLQATGAITASGKIVASKASDVVFDSARSSVTMARGSSIATAGGSVSLQAHSGMAVAGIDTRGAKVGTGGLVELASNRGTITDANRDHAVDIRAQGVTLRGLGPRLGAGDVLEVSAPLVRIVPSSGAVLRESGLDGRNYFNVLQGARSYQALVAVGPVAQISSDLGQFVRAGKQAWLTGGEGQSSAGAADSRLAQSLGGQVFAGGQVLSQGKRVDYWSEVVHL